MITLTDIAATKMQAALAARGKGIGMRIGVRTTGCSGMAYTLEFADSTVEGDIEFDQQSVKLIVSTKDLVYLEGMQVDYQRKGLNEGFEFINPNESARCGCGESFTV
jgi:iron-sulfur cluster assembly protein